MTNVIPFPTKKPVVRLTLTQEVDRIETTERMQRIQERLRKINQLFQELKESTNASE